MRAFVWSLGLLGCVDPTTERTRPPPIEPTEDDTAAVTGPSDTAATAEPVAFASAPALRRNPLAGLTAFLDVELTTEAELVVDVDAGGRRYTLHEPAARVHEVLLTGLRPDADLVAEVTAVGADGSVAGPEQVSVHTAPLPASLRLPVVQAFAPERMEPGFTVVTDDANHVILIDAQGEPVWFVTVGARVNEVSFGHDGLVRYDTTDRMAIEVRDLAGRRQLRLSTATSRPQAGEIRTELTAMHHDVVQLPGGTFLTFDITKERASYPTSEQNPRAPWDVQWVARDVVRELDATGAIVDSWPLEDLLDRNRIGRSSVSGDFWFEFSDWDGEQVRDWAHPNALSYHEPTDAVLVSARHQDALAAFRRSTGELLWIVAPPTNWRSPWREKVLLPEDPEFRYFYHQHGAKFLPDGSVLLFDNGNYQHSAWEAETGSEEIYSRVVQLRPDPEAGTFREVWSWGDDPERRVYSPSMGDADWLPLTDNVLVTVGNPVGDLSPTILEVARDGTVVWSATKRDSDTWYRSARVSGLFPWEDGYAPEP